MNISHVNTGYQTWVATVRACPVFHIFNYSRQWESLKGKVCKALTVYIRAMCADIQYVYVLKYTIVKLYTNLELPKLHSG